MLNTIFIAFQLKPSHNIKKEHYIKQTHHKKEHSKVSKPYFFSENSNKDYNVILPTRVPKEFKKLCDKVFFDRITYSQNAFLSLPLSLSSILNPHSSSHPISHFYMPNDVCLTSPSRGHFSTIHWALPTSFYQLYYIEIVRRGNSDFLLRYNFETTIKYL